MEDYQDRLVIATPEGIEIALDLAGLGSRFTAGLIDLVIKTVIIIAIEVPAFQSDSTAAAIVGIAAPLLVYIGYDVLFETLASGRTPGKRLTGLRVLRADGGPEDVVASLIRNVLRLIDGLPLSYVPAIVSILLTRRNQRVGDLAAGTIVVRERIGGRRAGERGAPPEFAAIPPNRPAESAYGPSHKAATVAAPAEYDLSGLTDAELAMVRSFLDRRYDLDMPVRSALAQRLAAAVRPKVAGPLEGLDGERFLEAIDGARRR